MSDKIPISLHNSDLFLNPEFTDTDNKKISRDNAKKLFVRKGPSLGENNHLVSLHSSHLLPPLHSSTYLNKAVTSYLLANQKVVDRHKNEPIYESKRYNGGNRNDKQDQALLSATGSSFGKDVFPLRYELRSGLTPRSKGQTELIKKKNKVWVEPHFVLSLHALLAKSKLFASNARTDSKIYNHSTKIFPGFSLTALKKLNRGISSSISREFLFVTTNLILFAVLTVVQRTGSGKGSSPPSGSNSQTMLSVSKMCNTTPFYFNAAGIEERLHPIKAGCLNPVREHVVGIFLGKSDRHSCRTGMASTAGQALHKKKVSFLLLRLAPLHCMQKHKETPAFHTKRLFTNRPQRSADLVEHLIQPWYYIKACNTCKSSVVATRSLWKTDTNANLYNDSKIWGVQYYLPFYKSKERVLIESDTIPAKREGVYSKKTIHLERSRKLEPNSCVAVSQSVLTKLFYKYGLLLVSSPQKTSESQLFKEKGKGSLLRSQNFDQINQRLVLPESRDEACTCVTCKKSTLYKSGAFAEAELLYKLKFLHVSDAKVFTMHTMHVSTCLRKPRAWQKLAEPTCIKTRSHIRFETLKTTTQGNPLVSYHKRSGKENSYFHTFVSNLVKGLLPTVSKSKFNRYSFVLNKIDNFGKSHKKERNAFFPLGFAWSQHNMSNLTFTALVPLQSHVPIFGFLPDNLVQNSSVSGYQFADLQDKEISYLFRKTVIFHFYFNKQREQDNAFCHKLFTQITTPFRALKKGDLVTQTVSTPFLINENGGTMCKVNTKGLRERSTGLPCLTNKAQIVQINHSDNKLGNLRKAEFKGVRDPDPSFEVNGIKMEYTQVDLDDTKNIFDLFKKLGRDYEDYLRRPKDSLPALIISPSLEDDREIEEEGIRTFRKRDLVKNKQINSNDKNGEGHVDPALFVLNTAPELSENKGTSLGAASKNEIQSHQFLVKNALRQAQEEIDNIAKKEEKSADKEKQVIPPLTRLEALYTIRNREKKREQAKDFVVDKGIISHFRSNKTKLSSRVGTKLGDAPPETKRTGRHTPLPIFEKLALYSDKPNDHGLNECVFKQNHARNKVFPTQSTAGLTPWLLSKLGDDSLCTDRKHSFFGEMSLPSNKLTAQEQKQIFQQKANPLLKTKAKDLEFEKVDDHNFGSDSISGTVPLSLLSQFSVLRKANDNKNQPPRFKVGAVRVNFLRSSDSFRPKNRIYFYDIFSQNKVCQGSAPKIKSTPLQSPVSHRVWQPKRMEPSTFRVPQRIKSTPVLPKISQKDWKNIMEWQLKKYFVEEDKRLFPLSLNTNKTLKIKKINLYLPWICIKKGNDYLNKKAEIVSSQSFNAWPATRLDLTNNPIQSYLKSSYPPAQHCSDTHYQPANYWRLPTQQDIYAASLPVKRKTSTSSIYTDQSGKQSLNLQAISGRTPRTNLDTRVLLPKKKAGICQMVFNESILFESVTRYSWLFIYTFFFVFMFKQLFTFVYKVGLKDFFVNFLNSDFGRTITSEEFRYSVQNSPLTEFYRPTKRLEELFGLEKNKVQLLEIVWFLRNNCQGRNGVRGILLVGGPGVENVSVVQAIAGEANLPIVVQSLEKIAQDNEPQRQLEQLYMRAQKQGPCVLFLDQLDTVGARRDQLFTDSMRAHNGNPLLSSNPAQDNQLISSLSSQSSLNSHMSASVLHVSPEVHLLESHSNKNNTISSNPFQKNQDLFTVKDQNVTVNKDLANTSPLSTKQTFVPPGNKLNVVLRLLTILDGITQSSGVVTVATTRDLSKLDPALLRPKRFDRKIYLSLPNQQDRVRLFKMHTQSIGHIKEMPWNYLSLQTESMSAADIRSAINYSLFRAVLKNSVHTVETLEYGISCLQCLLCLHACKN